MVKTLKLFILIISMIILTREDVEAKNFNTKVNDYIPHQVLIKFHSNPKKIINFSHLNFDQSVNTLDGQIYLYEVKNKNLTEKEFFQLISEIKKNDLVKIAEPNFIYKINPVEIEEIVQNSARKMKAQSMNDSLIPNDPLFNQLWGLRNVGQSEPTKKISNKNFGVVGSDIDALKAWDITQGDRKTVVAIIDTGIDYNHPDLIENMWVNEKEKNGLPGVDDDQNGYIDDVYGYDFANNDGDPMDGNGHGTHCAGTIGAVHNNGIGVAGVMKEVTMVPIKFLGDDGSGSTLNAIKAIDYATTLNVDIMSNSWGGGGYSELLKESIQRAHDQGILFVAAAGNSRQDNDARPNYPSNYPVNNIIGVAAHTYQDQLASFSSFGAHSVHIAAPGKSILSTMNGNRYASLSGTSMSTPHVSGALGLLLSHLGRMDFNEVKERLIKTSVPVKSLKRKVAASGRLNAYNLLTDTRPDRFEPDPSLWKRINLSETYESSHPYLANQLVKKVLKVPGAKYIRVVVEQFDLESSYDFLSFKHPQTGEVVSELSGAGNNTVSEYVEGDEIEVEFRSDYSVNKWGFIIKSVEIIL